MSYRVVHYVNQFFANIGGEEMAFTYGELQAEMDDDGHLHVNRILHASGPLDDAQWQRLLEVAAKTPVTKVMREGATITSERGS